MFSTSTNSPSYPGKANASLSLSSHSLLNPKWSSTTASSEREDVFISCTSWEAATAGGDGSASGAENAVVFGEGDSGEGDAVEFEVWDVDAGTVVFSKL